MGEVDKLREENARLRDENARLLAEVAPLRAYRQAYFAHWAAEMHRQRDYARNRALMHEDELEAWIHERDRKFYVADPRDTPKWKMSEAEYALTDRACWPADYAQLVMEMKEEFGE